MFSGQFVAESSLLRMGHLDVDNAGNPIIDQFGRCSDPNYFATGNITHPIETAGHCWSEGIKTARQVFSSLNGQLEHFDLRLKINSFNEHIKYITPQLLAISKHGSNEPLSLQLRVKIAIKGQLSLTINGVKISNKQINALPERRIELKTPRLTSLNPESYLEVCFEAH